MEIKVRFDGSECGGYESLIEDYLSGELCRVPKPATRLSISRFARRAGSFLPKHEAVWFCCAPTIPRPIPDTHLRAM